MEFASRSSYTKYQYPVPLYKAKFGLPIFLRITEVEVVMVEIELVDITSIPYFTTTSTLILE
jgi:hypothetical protein